MSCKRGVALYKGWSGWVEKRAEWLDMAVEICGISTGVGKREGWRDNGGSEVSGEVKESVLAGEEGDS